MITAPDPCDPASLVDEFARISRTVAVVLSRDLIKNLAVTVRVKSNETQVSTVS
jgi:hypothetical protein